MNNTADRPLIQYLLEWKLSLLFMLAGVAIGVICYLIAPSAYQSKASVIVDFNVEENWNGTPDNEIFYFLDREARKLEELAWSDQVLFIVADQVGIPVAALRQDVLSLSQPKDGGWHFYARSDDIKQAELIAGAWASAFAEVVNENITGDNPLEILENIAVTPSQISDLPTKKLNSLAAFSLIGALSGWLVGLIVLMVRKR